ncbi:MAG: phosphonate ABC transporter, permease protein PhnE [Dermatophilus congolensis]|nr:phosphonate ABC transporter, permease protein PhnE [Dermatophilus congolensis]
MTAPVATATRSEAGSAPTPRRSRSFNEMAVWVVLGLLFAAAVWSTIELRINLASIVDSIDNAGRFMSRMFPLDFPPIGELIGMIAETLAIVVLATVLAVILSLPVAVLAAANTTTGSSARAVSRGVIVLSRAIPDLILAIVFFRIFGLGALPGILAMGIHSIGMVGKLLADAIESLDNGPIEAVRSSGGGRLQQIVSGVLPQLMPQIIATGLHRFDINLRTSVLLGYVGVGGIGLAISESLRSLNYQRGMALALTVLVLCIVVELTSGAIRAAIMDPPSGGTWADKLFARLGSGAKVVEPKRVTPPWTAERAGNAVGIGALALVILASLAQVEISPESVLFGLANIGNTIGMFFPPATGGVLGAMLEGMLVTVQIALSATLIGSIFALPIGVFAARNVVANTAVRTTFRMLIVFIRGLPELIIAIIFVVISGLGGVAGTLALALGAIGLLSKLVADSLEETDTDVQEAVRATGATEVQVFFSATLRQAAPAFVAHIMYLLDTNIRSATLLGIVGAGGIGFLLLNASRVMQFDVVTTILLLILAVVLAVEALSIWIRKSVQ